LNQKQTFPLLVSTEIDSRRGKARNTKGKETMARRKNKRRKPNESKGGGFGVLLAVVGVGAVAMMAMSGGDAGTPITALTPEQHARIKAVLDACIPAGLVPEPWRAAVAQNPNLLLEISKSTGMTNWRALSYLFVYLILYGYVVAASAANAEYTNVQTVINAAIAALKKRADAEKSSFQAMMIYELRHENDKALNALVAANVIDASYAAQWKAAIQKMIAMEPL